MSSLLLKLLPLLAPAVPYLVGLGVTAAGVALTAWLLKRRATAQLAGAVPVLEDLANAEAKVIASDLGDPKKIPADALKAAGDVLKADAGQLVTTAKAELDTLANPNPATTADVGNATVNLPPQGK